MDICPPSVCLMRQSGRIWDMGVIPFVPAKSRRNLPNPAIKGLSNTLLPFCPRNPHRFVTPLSLVPSRLAPTLPAGLLLRAPSLGLGGPRCTGFGLPPRIAETVEGGDRACLWIADVIDMHSEMTREMGSTATDTGRLRYCIRGASLLTGGAAVAEGRGTSMLPFITESLS